jgi:hypothetical protein
MLNAITSFKMSQPKKSYVFCNVIYNNIFITIIIMHKMAIIVTIIPLFLPFVNHMVLKIQALSTI